MSDSLCVVRFFFQGLCFSLTTIRSNGSHRPSHDERELRMRDRKRMGTTREQNIRAEGKDEKGRKPKGENHHNH